MPEDGSGSEVNSVSPDSIPGGQLDLRSFQQFSGHEPNPFDTSQQWSQGNSIAQRDDSARSRTHSCACLWCSYTPTPGLPDSCAAAGTGMVSIMCIAAAACAELAASL